VFCVQFNPSTLEASFDAADKKVEGIWTFDKKRGDKNCGKWILSNISGITLCHPPSGDDCTDWPSDVNLADPVSIGPGYWCSQYGNQLSDCVEGYFCYGVYIADWSLTPGEWYGQEVEIGIWYENEFCHYGNGDGTAIVFRAKASIRGATNIQNELVFGDCGNSLYSIVGTNEDMMVGEVAAYGGQLDISFDCSDCDSWAISTSYTFADSCKIVQHDSLCYNLRKAHTSAASNEPGVGADWREYWEI